MRKEEEEETRKNAANIQQSTIYKRKHFTKRSEIHVRNAVL